MRGRRNNLVVNRRRFIQGAGAAAGAIAVGLVLPRQSWGQDAPPQVVVGQVVPFTGSAAEYGQYYRDAAAPPLRSEGRRVGKEGVRQGGIWVVGDNLKKK